MIETRDIAATGIYLLFVIALASAVTWVLANG